MCAAARYSVLIRYCNRLSLSEVKLRGLQQMPAAQDYHAADVTSHLRVAHEIECQQSHYGSTPSQFHSAQWPWHASPSLLQLRHQHPANQLGLDRLSCRGLPVFDPGALLSAPQLPLYCPHSARTDPEQEPKTLTLSQTAKSDALSRRIRCHELVNPQSVVGTTLVRKRTGSQAWCLHRDPFDRGRYAEHKDDRHE